LARQATAAKNQPAPTAVGWADWLVKQKRLRATKNERVISTVADVPQRSVQGRVA
jgi:hypothetical protein